MGDLKRLERLHAIVEHLRARKTAATVADLAERFGVTERTLFRDLAALRENQVPIEADPGHGGGVRLARGYTLPPLGLSIDEAVSMWLAIRLSEATLSASGPALEGALEKMISAIPETLRADFRSVARRIVIGTAPWASVVAKSKPYDPDIFRACEEAVIHGHVVALEYVDKTGKSSAREVEPHGLLAQPPVWYLLTIDRTRGAPRSLRIDRITRATPRRDLRFDPRDPRTLFPELQQLKLERPGRGKAL